MASDECPRQAITPWKSFIPECTSTSGPGQPGTLFISTGQQRARAPVGTAWRSAFSQEHRAGCAAGSAHVYPGPGESPVGQTDRPVLVELGHVPTQKEPWGTVEAGAGRKGSVGTCRRGLQTEGSRAVGKLAEALREDGAGLEPTGWSGSMPSVLPAQCHRHGALGVGNTYRTTRHGPSPRDYSLARATDEEIRPKGPRRPTGPWEQRARLLLGQRS